MGAYSFLTSPKSNLPADRTIVRAQGTRLTFADGSAATCLTSGLWNASFGYGNRTVREAIVNAYDTYSYATLFRYSHQLAERAAAGLLDAAGGGYTGVMFATSGGAALDIAVRLVRDLQRVRGDGRRDLVLSLKGSYHGTTLASLALTGDELGQDRYYTDTRRVRHIDATPDALAEMAAAYPSRLAGIVIEPVIGSFGTVVTAEFLSAIFDLRRETGLLVVADEVATGMHRCGPVYVSTTWAEGPDLMITSKGLTNGSCAASAILFARNMDELFGGSPDIFVHGETQAGDSIACGAILGVLKVIGGSDFRESAASLEQTIRSWSSGLGEGIELVGQGAFWYVRWDRLDGRPERVRTLVDAIRARGVVVHPGARGIGIMPALVIDPTELSDCLDRIASACTSI